MSTKGAVVPLSTDTVTLKSGDVISLKPGEFTVGDMFKAIRMIPKHEQGIEEIKQHSLIVQQLLYNGRPMMMEEMDSMSLSEYGKAVELASKRLPQEPVNPTNPQ